MTTTQATGAPTEHVNPDLAEDDRLYIVVSSSSRADLARRITHLLRSGDWMPCGGVFVVPNPNGDDGPPYAFFQALDRVQRIGLIEITE